MQFWKMNGAGNDFILMNNLEERIPAEKFPALARTLCRRRMSIGADGLMAVDRAEADGDFKMRFYNADGSEGEMCGNGARCICRYAYEQGIAGEVQRVETIAGLVTGWRISQREYRIRLNEPTTVQLNCPVELDGVVWHCSYVELGNPGLPHVIVPYHGLRQADEERLRELGRRLRWHSKFPKGTNVNFYDWTDGALYERTFERGVEDFTYACGTGAGSLAAVLTLTGEADGKHIPVDTSGGRLIIDAVQNGTRVSELYLTGPALVVCKGEVTEDALSLSDSPIA